MIISYGKERKPAMLKEKLNLNKDKAQKLLLNQLFKESIGNPKLEYSLISELIHKCSSYEDYMWTLYKKSEVECLSELTFLLQEIAILEPQLAWSCLIKQKKYAKEYRERYNRSKYILAAK
jgi:hypothetical protein